MDFEERQALIAEGVDPDDPAVRTALDMVRWELQLMGHRLEFGEPTSGHGYEAPKVNPS